MDLPTYTNIWRIEKRLYKLYDLRLPMPLPLVQIGVFAGVFVPWIVLLRFVGVPFESPWHVLYIVPPGVLTWLATRPVIEGKRLTELLLSHSRYLAEPRTWCRLTPIREPREVVIVARVWRRAEAPAPAAAPERAAVKSRRKARKAQPVVEEAPTPVLTPSPAVASAPQPLAEYAAQRQAAAPESPAPFATQAALAERHEDGHVHSGALSATPRPPAREPAAHVPAPRPHTLWTNGAAEAARDDDESLRNGEPQQRNTDAPDADDAEKAAAGAKPAAAPRRTYVVGTENDVRVAGPESRSGRKYKPWRRTSRDIAHEDDMWVAHSGPAAAEGQPGELDRPPATPLLEASPSGQDAGQGSQTAGSGKRAFASGVRRPGEPAELWQAAEPGGHEQRPAQAPPVTRPDIPRQGARPDAPEQAAPERPAATRPDIPRVTPPAPVTRPDIPVQAPRAGSGAPKQTRPDIPMVPGAFGGGGHPEPPKPPEPREEAPQQPPENVAEEPQEDTRPQAEQTPWTEEPSKPLRPATTDALVWPPLPPEPRPEEPVSEQQRPDEQRPEEQRVQEPAFEEQRVEEPRFDERRSGELVPEFDEQALDERRSAQAPFDQEEAEGARLDEDDEVAVAQVEADEPPREVRSGPASPIRPGPPPPQPRVRPRPVPPPPEPPAQGPAITPPDPEQQTSPGGLRRLLQAVGGGHGEADAEYEQRLQQPFQGTRHIVVLGCTGGAGQTVTALMLGHTFAQHNGEPVVAIDINPGPGALARRTRSETNETLTGLITRADQVTSLTAMRRYTSQAKSGLDVIAAGKNPLQALDDRDYALAIRTIDKFYSVTLLDAAAAVVARVLPYADQLVLVAPASADAPRAVAMTFEWLDGHGYAELRSRAVTVINGVSRRSMDDVEQAESVARGRCRALVRIPWDDHLSMDRAPRNELRSLRAPTRRAYLALAGVVAGGFTIVPERYQEPQQQEQEATR